jgi:hypothetical protein
VYRLLLSFSAHRQYHLSHLSHPSHLSLLLVQQVILNDKGKIHIANKKYFK